MKDFQFVQFKPGKLGIARIILNRPEKANALNELLIQEFLLLLTELEQDNTIKAIFIEANGKIFCAGMDFAWQEGHINTLQNFFHRLFYSKKILVAFVEGDAYGGGVGILACCDIVFCRDDIKFRFPEVTLGLAPALISPYVIQAIGTRQAARFFLTADFLSAEQAFNLNLVHQLFPKNEMKKVIADYEGIFSALDSDTLELNKKLLKSYQKIDAETNNYTRILLNKASDSAYYKQKLEAFHLKRLNIKSKD